MSRVEELQEQIQKLSREEFAELRNGFWNQTGWLKEAEGRLAAYRSGDLTAVAPQPAKAAATPKGYPYDSG